MRGHTRAALLMLAALVVLAIAACSTPGHDADDADKRTGFYGGFSGGMTVP